MNARAYVAAWLAAGLVFGLAAATVTINPGNGVETNVTARITGATDVVVNSGATGGGIVTLANPLSTYTGKTTVNSGTLVVPDGDVAKGRSSIGSSGPIVLGQGTLRASGTLGAVVTNTYAASSKLATVLDVQDELHITNDFVQKTGCFIKTGPGTVYFSGSNNRFGWDPDVANGAVADTANPLCIVSGIVLVAVLFPVFFLVNSLLDREAFGVLREYAGPKLSGLWCRIKGKK